MFRLLGKQGAWRLVAALVLTLAIALPFLPTAAYAAPAESPRGDGYWYIVVAGDTLSQLARQFGTSVEAIQRANGLHSTRIYVGQRLLIPEWKGHDDKDHGDKDYGKCVDWYKVKSGDNLSRIAARFGVSWSKLAEVNHLSNPRVIVPGQRLCIPAGGHGHDGWDDKDDGWKDDDHGHHSGGCYYTVRAGDNLSQIAKIHGVSWSYLARVNHLSNPRVIIPGQRLYVCK